MGFEYVVLINKYGTPVFLVDPETEEAILFYSYTDADVGASKNDCAMAQGYQVVKIEW